MVKRSHLPYPEATVGVLLLTFDVSKLEYALDYIGL